MMGGALDNPAYCRARTQSAELTGLELKKSQRKRANSYSFSPVGRSLCARLGDIAEAVVGRNGLASAWVPGPADRERALKDTGKRDKGPSTCGNTIKKSFWPLGDWKFRSAFCVNFLLTTLRFFN